MSIYKRCWDRLRHFADSTLLFFAVSAVIAVVLFLGFYIQSKSQDASDPQHVPRCCMDNKAVLFFSLPGTQSLSTLLLPLIQFTSVESIPYLEVEADGAKWKAAALKTDNVGTLLAEFSKELVQEKLLPLVSVILDNSGAEYLLLIGTEGQVCLSSMKFLVEHFLVESKGRSSVEIKLPHDWGSNADHSPFYLRVN